jgi:hypothetical protein
MPTSVIADPLNDRQKIRLLELVLSNNLEPNDKGIFTKALSSLSNGDFLDLAEVASLSEEAQGLFLFLSHNVPQRVLEIDASYYEGVSEGAVIACAFLAGLRFRRQLVPLDRVVIPVRDHHVMRSIHTLNALSSALPEPSVSVDKNSIVLNGHRIERASEFYVLDFIDGSVSVIASHIVNDRKQLELHKGVLKVVVRGRAQVSRVAAKVQWRPRRDYESQLAESLFYECRKSRFSLKLFSNRSIEPFMEEVPVLEISFTDDVWIVRPQETLHLVKPVLTFRNSPDRPFLGLSDKKPKKVDVRRRFMPQRLSLS